MSIRGAVESIDQLIELKKKQLELLAELRRSLAIAEKAGVDPNLIEKFGYDQHKDKRWQKWPPHMKKTIEPETNYVILEDGTRIDWEIDWEGPLEEDKRKWREKLEKATKGLPWST